MEVKDEGPASPPLPLYQIRFNYLFFGSYFLVAAAIHILHVFLVEPQPTFSRFFFAGYALMQCALETCILILIAAIFRQFLPRFFYLLYAALIFILFLGHVIDFPLVRLMDMSFWFALHFVSQESYQNFMELLYASNVSLFVWGAAGLAALGIIMGGVWIFRSTEKWTDRHPISTTYPFLIAIMCTMTLFMVNWEASAGHLTSATQMEMYQKSLPWKTTFTPPPQEQLRLEYALKIPEEEQDALRSLDSRAFSLARRPDIYLFIVESLREDFITEAQAPNLHAFKNDNVHFDLALSNANATQISWFSIFFSKFPLYWGKIKPENWKGGSIPLKMLKKMGYKIHAFSSSRLGYYQMDHMIFGEAKYLADTLFLPDEEEFEEPYQRDQIAIEKLVQEMKDPNESSGRVFLVFLDATHLDYSWPKETFTKFHPFEEKINYFKAALSNQGLDGIKNRYRNALYFVDSLMGQFFNALNQYPGGKEAVVVVTGDHGEEFYEHGHLFHASSLTRQQTHVPLYYRFGSNEWKGKKAPCELTSHMDIFPTVLHYLIGEDLFGQVLQGQSIFKEERWPYVVAARFNASRAPYEFFIHNGEHKMMARFNDERDIFNSKALQIISAKNLHEENIAYDLTSLKEHFGEAIDHLCGP